MLSVDCEKKKEKKRGSDCASMKCKDTAQKNGPCPADAVAILAFGSYIATNLMLMLQGPTWCGGNQVL